MSLGYKIVLAGFISLTIFFLRNVLASDIVEAQSCGTFSYCWQGWHCEDQGGIPTCSVYGTECRSGDCYLSGLGTCEYSVAETAAGCIDDSPPGTCTTYGGFHYGTCAVATTPTPTPGGGGGVCTTPPWTLDCWCGCKDPALGDCSSQCAGGGGGAQCSAPFMYMNSCAIDSGGLLDVHWQWYFTSIPQDWQSNWNWTMQLSTTSDFSSGVTTINNLRWCPATSGQVGWHYNTDNLTSQQYWARVRVAGYDNNINTCSAIDHSCSVPGAWTNVATVRPADCPGGAPPPAPTNLRASCPAPGTNASFSWDAASGASDYLVRIDNLANPWAGCAPANPGDICATVSGTSYSTPTTPGANYSWWVFSRNASGTSVRALGPNITCSIVAPTNTPTPTPTATPTPVPPTLSVILTANPASGNRPLNDVDLTADVSGTATGNIRYQFDCTNDGSYELDTTNSSDPFTAVDLCDYASAATYNARVRVTRQGVVATATAVINVSDPPPGAPNPPANLTSSCPLPGTNATISWSASAGATSYAVRVDNLANGWNGNCASPNPGDYCQDGVVGTSYSFISTPGASYTWWVHAVNGSGWSAASTASFSCPAGGPGQCEAPVPTDPPAADCAPLGGNTRVYWRWNTVADATEYEIDIQEETGGVFVTMPAFDNDFAAPGSYYTCSGGLCSYETFLPAGNYQSAIRARGICSESDVSDPYVQSVIECPAQAWWQINGGNAITGGIIQSLLPVGENFSLGSYPGVPIYSGGSFSFDPAGRDSVSSTNWLANASYSGPSFNYSYATSKIPTYVTFNALPASVNNGDLHGGAESRGYYWYRRTDDTSIDNPINIVNRRVVMIVDGGNLDITQNINVGNDGFLMIIVDGDISIDQSVTGVEGIFLVEGRFYTGTTGSGDTPLVVRGSVAAWGGVELERDLADNSTTPAEVFEFAPEFVVNYPPELGIGDIVWKEVLP